MSIQPEKVLENKLIRQLQTLGFEKAGIKDEADLVQNLKRQLEKHNRTDLSEAEFRQVLNKIARGNIFEKAKILRDKVDYAKDDGAVGYIELLDQINWCKNQYQVTHQVTMKGTYANRYDVTLLVNGLPLVQIELKRRGLELKEAFNQTNRYHRHSYNAGYGLFGYIQVFVISNGVNTKYFANNPVSKRDFKQTFYWADKSNARVTKISEFAETFLEKCQLSKLIVKYVVLNESDEMLMVLRSYQYHAVEAIVERVKISEKFGYVWHTTGSGKTLTSFKTAQILTQSPLVHKVMFVVDRKDLDDHTIHEFNSYSKGSVDATDNTRKLVEQLGDDTRLIVTTLQKLNNAISRARYSKSMSGLQDERMVFIFDECHRSQFGDTHKRIRKCFPRAQMFGFTGTPIFAENSSVNVHGKRTTKDLFRECLHKYIITDAIRDEDVLKFMVDYIQTIKRKDGVTDIEVEDINRVEVMEADERIDAITDYIIENHNRKTSSREFTAIFCVSSIRLLTKYYERFRQKQETGEHSLKIGAIFSYQVNEDDSDANGFIETDLPADGKGTVNLHSRDRLESYIRDYNGTFGTKFSTDSFYGYYKDIGKRVKRRELDVLLVVNMFLTGFNSKTLNTIYVDKNLRHHGLIQAYSRTNRILGTRKSQGNVVCFRNLKDVTDQAIELFANRDAAEEIILQPYEDSVEKFILAAERLNDIAPTVDSVNELHSEEDEAEFVQAFRELIRIKNVLSCFTEFSFDDLPMDEQQFEDYKSKYLDLYDKVKNNRQKEKVSILDDIDFELELIHRDEINVGYILELLRDLQSAEPPEQERIRSAIHRILETNAQLRSKKELIERFIAEQFALMPAGGHLRQTFEDYWKKEKEKAVQTLSKKENLKLAGLRKVIDDYLFTEITPLRGEIIDLMKTRPRLRERSSAAERIIDKIKAFVEKFVDGMD